MRVFAYFIAALCLACNGQIAAPSLDDATADATSSEASPDSFLPPPEAALDSNIPPSQCGADESDDPLIDYSVTTEPLPTFTGGPLVPGYYELTGLIDHEPLDGPWPTRGHFSWAADGSGEFAVSNPGRSEVYTFVGLRGMSSNRLTVRPTCAGLSGYPLEWEFDYSSDGVSLTLHEAWGTPPDPVVEQYRRK